jgi:hypothetical protein
MSESQTTLLQGRVDCDFETWVTSVDQVVFEFFGQKLSPCLTSDLLYVYYIENLQPVDICALVYDMVRSNYVFKY